MLRRTAALSISSFSSFGALALFVAFVASLCCLSSSMLGADGSSSLLVTFASAGEMHRRDDDNSDSGGNSNKHNKGGSSSSASAKWNGDRIEWVSFKQAKAMAERRLALEEEAAAEAKALKRGGGEGKRGRKVRGHSDGDAKANRKNRGHQKSDDGAATVNDNKPMLLLFHKSYCPACKALERSFSGDGMALEVLSSYFTMVSIPDDEDPADPMYEPQGAYFPRVMFTAANGTVLTDVKNDPPIEVAHEHYFADADSVAVAMKKVMQLVGGFTTFRGL